MQDTSQGEYIDAETGEVLSLTTIKKPKRKHNRGPWVQTMTNSLKRMVQEHWTPTEYQVFLYLLANLEWDNWLHVTAKSVAEGTNRPRANVTRALQALVRRGVIHKVDAGAYRMDPHLAWRGNDDAWARVDKEIRDSQ